MLAHNPIQHSRVFGVWHFMRSTSNSNSNETDFIFFLFSAKWNLWIHHPKRPTEDQSTFLFLKRAKTTSVHISLVFIVSKQHEDLMRSTHSPGVFFFASHSCICSLFVTSGICQVCPRKSNIIVYFIMIIYLWILNANDARHVYPWIFALHGLLIQNNDNFPIYLARNRGTGSDTRWTHAHAKFIPYECRIQLMRKLSGAVGWIGCRSFIRFNCF